MDKVLIMLIAEQVEYFLSIFTECVAFNIDEANLTRTILDCIIPEAGVLTYQSLVQASVWIDVSRVAGSDNHRIHLSLSGTKPAVSWVWQRWTTIGWKYITRKLRSTVLVGFHARASIT